MAVTYVVRAEIKVILSQQDIDDIMVAALEGGINYWCRKAEVVGDYLGEFASDQISREGTILLYDAESDEKWELTLFKFLTGFKMWLEDGQDKYEAVKQGEVDCCNIDAGCADEIVQYALFGKVMFR